MKSVDVIRKELADQHEKLASLCELKKTREQSVAKIGEKRSALLVPALTGNREAQKNLDLVTDEFDAAVRVESDVLDAVGQTEREIARLNAELKASEREALRQSAQKLIEARLDGMREGQIRDLVQQLENEIATLHNSDSEIVKALGLVDPRLANAAREMFQSHAEPVRIDRGMQGRGPLDNFAFAAPDIFRALLNHLGPRAQSDEAVSDEGALAESASK